MREETVYYADDGKPCATREECIAHDKFLEALKPAEEYETALKAVGWQDGPALTRQLNVVKDYLAFGVTGTAPQPPEAKVKPPVDEKPEGKPPGKKGEAKKEK